MSACVMVCVAVKFAVAPTASVGIEGGVKLPKSILESVILILERGTSPVFSTVKL